MSENSNKLEAVINCESQLKPDPRVKFKIKAGAFNREYTVVCTLTFGLFVRLRKKTFHHLKKVHTKLLLNKC